MRKLLVENKLERQRNQKLHLLLNANFTLGISSDGKDSLLYKGITQ
ncbi:hypothetical protein FM038_25880 [Shewanella eurypsychrophilus]|uniref:Uncharacterized protein n=1 Tax=Shewanella eurypsychrophilus TaxID=2593656 RepID=A0ABX8S5A9_9GAMM|nr:MULTISPECIES: hypothetical protein [Shewanella]QXP44883.1 hypothetical protein FM038_25880 [Shewanella eurypsychrophilus]